MLEIPWDEKTSHLILKYHGIFMRLKISNQRLKIYFSNVTCTFQNSLSGLSSFQVLKRYSQNAVEVNTSFIHTYFSYSLDSIGTHSYSLSYCPNNSTLSQDITLNFWIQLLILALNQRPLGNNTESQCLVEKLAVFRSI